MNRNYSFTKLRKKNCVEKQQYLRKQPLPIIFTNELETMANIKVKGWDDYAYNVEGQY
jgi:hypothetical protein